MCILIEIFWFIKNKLLNLSLFWLMFLLFWKLFLIKIYLWSFCEFYLLINLLIDWVGILFVKGFIGYCK